MQKNWQKIKKVHQYYLFVIMDAKKVQELVFF